MYIDTHTQDSMVKSLTEYFNVTERELVSMLCTTYYGAYEDKCFYTKRFDSNIEGFLKNTTPKFQVNEILFFHLSRRLDDVNEDYRGDNLKDLLLSVNPFSSFLRQHRLCFFEQKDHIGIIKDGAVVGMPDDEFAPQAAKYLRWRLGYDSDKDYCINGFAIKDRIYKNTTYAGWLSQAPEFTHKLNEFFQDELNLVEDYYRQSKYYCLEFRVPIEHVLFDSNSNLSSSQEKVEHLLKAVFYRVASNYFSKEPNYDGDNPVIRLPDNVSMQSCWFVGKSEITPEMLMGTD